MDPKDTRVVTAVAIFILLVIVTLVVDIAVTVH